MNWKSASDFCASRGGRLPVIETIEENTDIANLRVRIFYNAANITKKILQVMITTISRNINHCRFGSVQMTLKRKVNLCGKQQVTLS